MAGVELATAYVSLVVEGSKVAPGVRDSLGAADGEATRAGERAGRSFTSKFGSALKIGATLGAAFAVTKGVQFLGDAIEEAREASVVTARTANVIKSMGNAARISADDVAAMAGRLSNLSGVDDEAIQSGQNLLLTFGNIKNFVAGEFVGTFDQASALMVDMSAAMGTDMKGSAIQLGKALNDPIKGITALSRVGVSFTEQQKEQIKTLVESGETVEAQGIILGELEKQFGGAAEAMATPAEKAEVAWGNLKEQIGEKLLPTVNRVLDWFSQKGVPAVSNFVDEFSKGEGTAGDIRDALERAKDMAVQFFDQFKSGKGFGGDVRDVMEDVRDAVQAAAGFAGDMVGWFNDMPSWAKQALIGGGVAAFAASKIPGGSALSGGAAKGLGSLLGSAKPLPVFVTNPGFGAGAGGGVGGKPGGAGTTGGKLGGLGLLGGAGAALGGMRELGLDEQGWKEIPANLRKINEAFIDIAKARTGLDGVRESAKALDGIISGMTLEKPRQGFAYLQDLSRKTGLSMADLRDLLPATSKAIGEAGGRAELAGRKTDGWKNSILGLGRETDKVDRKKPDLPWSFPGLFGGRDETNKLGGDVDRVGNKKPSVPFAFPNLPFGVDKVWDLDRGIANLPSRKDITITTYYNSVGRRPGGDQTPGVASGGPVMAGRVYRVGEVGEELIIPNVGSRVVPSNQKALVREMAGSAGPVTVNVYDVDNRLIGTMRGVVADNDRTKNRAMTARVRTGG